MESIQQKCSIIHVQLASLMCMQEFNIRYYLQHKQYASPGSRWKDYSVLSISITVTSVRHGLWVESSFSKYQIILQSSYGISHKIPSTIFADLYPPSGIHWCNISAFKVNLGQTSLTCTQWPYNQDRAYCNGFLGQEGAAPVMSYVQDKYELKYLIYYVLPLM